MSASWARAVHVERLVNGDAFDVAVIGGGVTGTGTALDLAGRGLKVALVEQHDFASGTSSRSTKLFHGGIRYLPQFQFQLVAEGLREQRVLARIADYLFEPLEFVVPVYDQHGLADAPAWAARGRRASIALGAGLTLYDFLGGLKRPGERHRRLRIEEVRRAAPLLRSEGLRGGFAYSDAQTDDARLVIALARTAVDRFDAVAVNRMRVKSLHARNGGFSISLADRLSGEEHDVSARAVVAATGAFPAPDVDQSRPLDLVLSKGAHMIVPKETIGLGDEAVVLPKTDDGRVLFLIPWSGHALIGTTDTEFVGDPAHPVASAEDIAYLIDHVRRYLDVGEFAPLSTFAGLRALADDGSSRTAQASREHVISEPEPGYFQVAGGKLTTYRRISAEVADEVAKWLRWKTKSNTAQVRLIGSGGHADRSNPLVRRYGTEASTVASFWATRPELSTVLGDGITTLGEVAHGVRQESVVSISDFTMRRTRLAWLTPDHARADENAIAAVMAAELGWTAEEIARQVAAHHQELEAEGL